VWDRSKRHLMMYKQIEIVNCADEDRFKKSLLVVIRARVQE